MASTPASSGSTFVRLLAALDPAESAAPRPASAQRLGGWLAWTDAIALSGALATSPAADPIAWAPDLTAAAATARRDADRTRAALVRLLGSDPATAPAPGRDHSRRAAATRQGASAAGAGAEEGTDFAPFRARYTAGQQAMEDAVLPLRRRVRAALAAAGGARAPLAATDEVLERVMGAQERTLLATVPRRLERRFDRLRAAGAPPATWLPAFRQAVRDVAVAELDLRLQPVEGLLAALHRPL